MKALLLKFLNAISVQNGFLGSNGRTKAMSPSLHSCQFLVYFYGESCLVCISVQGIDLPEKGMVSSRGKKNECIQKEQIGLITPQNVRFGNTVNTPQDTCWYGNLIKEEMKEFKAYNRGNTWGYVLNMMNKLI